MTRRPPTAALALGCLLVPTGVLATVRVTHRGGEQTGSKPIVDQRQRRASEIASRGLAWLAKQQLDDGSFSVGGGERDVTQAPVAVTALCALAFMADGSTLGRGKHRDSVARAIAYLLDKRKSQTFLGRSVLTGDTKVEKEVTLSYFRVESDSTSRMHGHGYATLALAEACGTYSIDTAYGDSATKKARENQAALRQALSDAVALIEWSQTTEGGWFYEPGDAEHEGSVTITMIQALRAARDVGVHVNKRVVDDAVAYVQKSQDEIDGSFKYSLTSDKKSYALTAAAISTLNATGDYASAVIDKGIEYMVEHDPVLIANPRFVRDDFPYYSRLYAAQAYFMYREPKLFDDWYAAVVEEFANAQNANGSIGSSDYGRVYSTASACLVLLLPEQVLPIFQR